MVPGLPAPAAGQADPAAGRPARAVAPPSDGLGAGEPPSRWTLRRRVRLVRRHLGSGPYLDYGGKLLAPLAARGSASAFVPDPTRAEAVRRAAPGCPVHTNPDAIPAGVFRGVLAVTSAQPDEATLATWRRVLVPEGGRVLVVGAEPGPATGFTRRWAGRERWRSGVAVVVLEAQPERMIGA